MKLTLKVYLYGTNIASFVVHSILAIYRKSFSHMKSITGYKTCGRNIYKYEGTLKDNWSSFLKTDNYCVVNHDERETSRCLCLYCL